MSTFPAASAAIRAAIAASSLWDGAAPDGGELLWLDIGPSEHTWPDTRRQKRQYVCAPEAHALPVKTHRR
jgi:hypothetical protein